MKSAYDTQAGKRCFRRVVGAVFGVSGGACTAEDVGPLGWLEIGLWTWVGKRSQFSVEEIAGSEVGKVCDRPD